MGCHPEGSGAGDQHDRGSGGRETAILNLYSRAFIPELEKFPGLFIILSSFLDYVTKKIIFINKNALNLLTYNNISFKTKNKDIFDLTSCSLPLNEKCKILDLFNTN